MRRFVAALVLVTAFAGAAEARPIRPAPPQTKPTFVTWLMRKVIGPIVIAGAKDLAATAIRSAIVSVL
jgi:hypothetical protein